MKCVIKIKGERSNLKKHKFLKNILIYTGIFTIIVGYIIYIFKKNGKGFIWQNDALDQHIVTLQCFRNMLIEFIKTGNFSTFSWYIGNGMNLWGNLGYYILGDFFSYFSILVPTNKVELLYSVLIFIRLYCVGISFLYFCKYKNMNTLSSIIGALMYAFCTFAMFSAVRHPYFINCMIIFPLIMVGLEKIIVDDKSIFYTIMIALLFIMNFYFAYMLAIIIALYGIILTIYTYKLDGIKIIVKKLVQILFYSLIGIMISAIVLLPTAMEFFNSERSSGTGIQPYSTGYYRNLMCDLLDAWPSSYWACYGVQSIILISLPVFIRKRKENFPIFWLTLILMVPLLISNVGSVFCGFSYPNNRWIFVISFLFSFITTIFINNGSRVDKKDLIAIVTFLLSYLLVNYIFEIDITLRIEIQIIIALTILLLIMNKDCIENKFSRCNLYSILLICAFSLGILFSVYYLYDVGNDNYEYVSEFVDSSKLNERINTSNNSITDFHKSIKYIKEKDSGFYSISKYPSSYQNVSIIKKYNSMSSYYSITPHYYKDISMDLQNIQYSVSCGIGEFDYRTKISTLFGIKYYIKNGNNTIPYGYTKLEDYNGKSEIYVNNYSLPFAVLYDNYITLEEYNKMTPLEKESSLLKTTALQNEEIQNTNIEHSDTVVQEIKENIIQEVDYNIIDKNQILQDTQIVVKDTKKNEIEIEIKEVKNSELYLYIDNIQYIPYTKEETINMSLGNKYTLIDYNKAKEKYKWYQQDYSYTITTIFNEKTTSKNVQDYKTSPYYFKNDQMLVNLGYYDAISGTITLRFSKVGTYDLSSIQILAVSMEDYEEDIKELKKSNFETISYENGYMKENVNVEASGILQFSTMYNRGWKVYVDGEQVDTFESNKYFLGIYITKGEHIVELKYETPYLKVGAVISISGIIILGGVTLFKRKNNKEKL